MALLSRKISLTYRRPRPHRNAGVLGRAVTEAEHVEGTGALDHVTCTEEARRRYLASSFEFSELPLPLRTVHAPPSTGVSTVPPTVLSRPLAEGRFHVSLRVLAE